MTTKKRGRGRPKSKDKRQPLPFRLKGSLIEKCRLRGRDWLEALIQRSRK